MDRRQQLVGLQHRPDVDIEHHGVHGPALRGIGELLVLGPGVRHGARERHHLFQHGKLVVHRLARRARQCRGPCRQFLDEFVALFGQQFDAVGGEQLVVADRGRDRAGARPRGAQARLHVVIAVAAGLERIDPHRLLARQAGGQRVAGIGALEVDFGGRPLRHELEMLGGGFQEIGDHRQRLALARRLLFLRLRINRPLRTAVDRRLRQHVIVQRNGLTFPALGVAALSLLGDRRPIGPRLPPRTRRALADIPSACGDIRRSPAARPLAPSHRRLRASSMSASIAMAGAPANSASVTNPEPMRINGRRMAPL